MWAVIKILREEEEEEFDVVPTTWIITRNTCYFPNARLSYVKSLVKNNQPPDPKWETLEIIVVESDIDDYDIAMKMMLRAAKQMALFSDEEKGRGLRQKKPPKQHTEIEEIPKESRNIKTKVGKSNVPEYPKTPRTFANVVCESSSGSLLCLSDGPNTQDIVHKCHVKYKHNCAFEMDEDSLTSIARQLCKLSVDINKIKASIKYLKEEQPSNPTANLQREDCDSDDHLFTLPVTSDEELKNLEDILTDPLIKKRLITMLVNRSDGKSMPKVVSSVMSHLITNKYACQFSWKGQKQKKPFQHFELAKAAVDSVLKKCATEDRCDIIKSVQLWLAQSSARCKRCI